MAARRLLTVLIVLLVVSSLAAALVPIERSDEEASTTTTTTTTTTVAASSRTIHAIVDATSGKRRAIEIAVGDRLELTVRSREPGQVDISDFGVLEDTDAALPAHFDLLAYQAGRFPVRLLREGERGRMIATIAVSARPPAERSDEAEDRDGNTRKSGEKGSKRARPAS